MIIRQLNTVVSPLKYRNRFGIEHGYSTYLVKDLSDGPAYIGIHQFINFRLELIK